MFPKLTAEGDSQTLHTSSTVVSLLEMHPYHLSLIGTTVKLDQISNHKPTNSQCALTHLLTFVV
jgi:hypothetical protein